MSLHFSIDVSLPYVGYCATTAAPNLVCAQVRMSLGSRLSNRSTRAASTAEVRPMAKKLTSQP